MTAELRSLTVHIDTGRWNATVLSGVDLCVPAGQITALLGGPGAGKTVLAYALTNRLPSTARYTGEVVTTGTVGYIPQDGIDAFVSDRTVGDQLREIEHTYRECTVAEACAAAQYPAVAIRLLPQLMTRPRGGVFVTIVMDDPSSDRLLGLTPCGGQCVKRLPEPL